MSKMAEPLEASREDHRREPAGSDQCTVEGAVQFTNPYQYKPLHHEDSIRILEIRQGQDQDSLTCKIVEARNVKGDYEALSYVWGKPVFSKSMLEEETGTYLAMTENLHCALRTILALRTLANSHAPTAWRIWVDALCIDQSNLDERNHQVKSMAGIYSYAKRVLVWLGQEDCGAAFQIFEELESRYLAIETASETSWILNSLTLAKKGTDQYEEEFNYHLAAVTSAFNGCLRSCDIKILSNFFTMSWFTRVWVVQEFVLAPEIEIFGGSKKSYLKYKTLEFAMNLLKTHQDFLPRTAYRTGLRRILDVSFNFENDYVRPFERFNELVQARETRRSIWPINGSRAPQSSSARSLYQWCRMLVDRQCTDDRDRVYAALGLSSTDLGIIPDYNLSLADVCLDLATRSLLTGDFSVLLHVGLPVTDNTPDFRPSFVPSLRAATRQNRPMPLGGQESQTYSAGPLRIPKVSSPSRSSVGIRGISINNVCYLDSFVEVLDELTIGKGKFYKPQLLEAYRRANSAWSMTFPNYDKLVHDINLGFLPVQDDVPHFERGLDFKFLDYPYRQNMARSFETRVFFMTELGDMGLGPNWLQKHDKVAIYDGAQTPLLLRYAGDNTWELVGNCHLDSWMEGDYSGWSIVDGEETDPTTAKEGTAELKSSLKSEFFTLC
jgi:hypothetical protein